MKKTDRKNKTGLNVTWPNGIFTIADCHKTNADFVKITLRVRIKNAIVDGIVNELGYLHNGKGRPCLVLVHGVITQDHVSAAKSRGVILKNNLSVTVMTITAANETKSADIEETANITHEGKREVVSI